MIRAHLSSMSARLLILTIAFVMLAEVLIFAPSAGRFRTVYLQERLATAHLAGLALEATPTGKVDAALEAQLLRHVGAYAVDIRLGPLTTRMLGGAMPPEPDIDIDLERESPVAMIMNAFKTFLSPKDTILRVAGRSPKDPSVLVTVIIPEAPMRMALIDYSRRILQLSLVISAITAGLVFLSLRWLMVQPMGRLTDAIIAFRAAPEDPTRGVRPSGRLDEIGVAERELAAMQRDLRQALAQKARLAALGEAVAKINHDLRNILSSAQLVSDSLLDSGDPKVRQMAPTLLRAIDRAVALCRDVVRYARTGEAKVRKARQDIRALLDDAGEAAVASAGGRAGVTFENHAPEQLFAAVDRAQLGRAIENLARNAYEAGADVVSVSATLQPDGLRIVVADNGPGIPAALEPRLFQPFSSSAKTDGSGLGLAIAAEIVASHGGRIVLARSGPDGAEFALTLPT